MPTARTLFAILAAAAATAAVAAGAEEKAPTGAQQKAPAGAQEKAPAGAEEKATGAESEAARPPAGRRVLNLALVSCGDYLRLSELEKAPVAWYLAGFYRATGVSPLEFDLEWATSTPPIVTMECGKRPGASLLYVVGNLFKPHTREKGKAKP